MYERYGYEPLETPAAENLETLMGKYGDEGNQLIFKILMRGEHEASGKADLALRYDLTVPLARVIAHHQSKLPRLFKRYQIQPVWRADRPARGRFREFYQCDVDFLGSTSPVVEAELCGAVAEVLIALGFSDFKIRINHRQILTSILSLCGIAEPQHSTALVALDKLDKIGRDGVIAELAERGIAGDSAAVLLDLIARPQGPGPFGDRSRRRRAASLGEPVLSPGAHQCGRLLKALSSQISPLREACLTTRARSWRSTFPTCPEVSPEVGVTTIWSACSWARASQPAGFRSGSSGSWW